MNYQSFLTNHRGYALDSREPYKCVLKFLSRPWLANIFPTWARKIITNLFSPCRKGRDGSAREADFASHVLIPRAERYNYQREIHFRRVGDEAWSKGTIMNISRSGVLFHAGRKVEPPVLVELRFELPKQMSRAKGARASGRAVIVREAGPSEPNIQGGVVAMYEDLWVDIRRIIGDDRGPIESE